MNRQEVDAIINCELCPRRCGVDRSLRRGFCQAPSAVKLALVSLHQWEEPCLVGECGAGTIFFSHCTMRCVFCQNHEISSNGFGIEVPVERLAQIFIEQQSRGAANIELVTPTHYIDPIIDALTLAKSRGLTLPVVWNSNGYELTSTLDRLNGLVDIYLPDLKYFDDRIAVEYSNAPHYFDHASQAIRTMFDQVGRPVFDGELMTRGVIVRHLVLPGHRRDSMAILDWLCQTFGDDIYISLMSQYTPMFRAESYKNLNRRLTTFEYQSVVDHALELGVKNCFVQTDSASSTDFVPNFDGSFII